jgi:4-hydroxy-3-methylbut-2-en-1-yl diphosphate reductase
MFKPFANRAAPTIGPGRRITLHLEIRLPDGTSALSTGGEDPLAITLGDGTLAPGLEALLGNLEVGVEEHLLVAGDDLYGPHSPDNIYWLPLAAFPAGQATEPGQVVAFDTPGRHELAGVVLEVNADRVRVDLNHPLSGKSLDVRAQILSVEGCPETVAAGAPLGQVQGPGLSPRPLSILIANPRGFCAGVDRAIDIVERAIELFGAPIYVRHEVVHNRFVVEDLRQRGAVFVDELDQVPDGATVIFSAHGVAQQVREEAAGRNLRVFDATCPLVTKVHLEVARHCKAGHEVILIGHRGHPEVEGTMGQCQGGGAVGAGRVRLVETIADVAALEVRDPERLAYVTQTTLSMDDTQAIVAALRERFPAIRGPRKSDICYATQNRQDAVKALAERCDLVLVVGSANSSNSNRLRELAERQGRRAYLIDGPDDIRHEWLADTPRVGLTAGASAPEVLVERVVERLKAWGACAVEEQAGVREQVVFALPRELVLEPKPGG